MDSLDRSLDSVFGTDKGFGAEASWHKQAQADRKAAADASRQGSAQRNLNTDDEEEEASEELIDSADEEELQETFFEQITQHTANPISMNDHNNALRMGNSRYLMGVVPDGTHPGSPTEIEILGAIHKHLKAHEDEIGGQVTLEGHKSRHKGGQPANEHRIAVRGQGFDVHLGYHRNKSHTKAGTPLPLRDVMVISRSDEKRKRARHASHATRLEQRDARLNRVRELLLQGCLAASYLFKPGSLEGEPGVLHPTEEVTGP
jgi:hypothetical protein